MVELIRIQNSFDKELNEQGFEMYRGWSEELAEDLVLNSREPEMLRVVPRDATERFRDPDSAHEWYKIKQPVVYSLARTALCGVIWFSESPREDLNSAYTFAIRMYEEARGKGVAGHFMKAAHDDFEEFTDYHGKLWLETDKDNIPAVKLYSRQGYEIAKESFDGRITMVKPKNTPANERP